MFDELRQGGERSSSVPITAGIDFERFTHANGLEIILHRDCRAPIVHVMVWYHVGSKDETPDRTGLAHLFEHMMFQGSQNVGKTQHFTYVQGVGGSLNATTGQDRTNYFQTVPREYLGMALWLEADRMRSLKVTMENFENQRSVVKEERRQRYDNAPYGLWYMTLLEMLFGGTPYGWSPIGDMAHLDAAPLDAIQEFHRLYYVPNNATLVVCGDFDREEALSLIDEQFGGMPKGLPVGRPSCAVEAPGVQRRREITASVPFPAVYLGFHSVPIAAGDAHALNVLALVLNRGRSSRLQRAMVYGTQTAQSVAAFNVDMESAGLFIVLATATEDSTADRLEEELWGVVEDVRANGVREREVEAALNHVRTSFVTSLCRLHGIADALAYYQVLCGDAGRINTLLDEFNAVTAADVERVARTYLLRDRAAVLHYLPG
ncbi:MAG: insulinase family protein [Bacteroidetes bacterium]|nr:insulinase family protein [Bacteroidota bacterium]